MLVRLFSIIFIIVILTTGCMMKAKEKEDPVEYSYTVLRKEIMSGKYILEISSIDEHKYIEVSKKNWNQIDNNNLVTFNNKDELLKINNKPIE